MSCGLRITSVETRTPRACSVVGAKPAMSESDRAPTARPVSLWAWVRVRDLVQPHQRIGLTDRQALQVRGDLAAERGRLALLLGHTHRDQCGQRAPRGDRLAPGQQPGPQASGDHRQYDVVDGVLVFRADRLQIGQRDPDRGEPPLLRHQPAQRRPGGRPPAAQRIPGQITQRATDPADGLPDRHRDAERAGQRARAGSRSPAPGPAALSHSAPTTNSIGDGSGSGCQLSESPPPGTPCGSCHRVQQHLTDVDGVDAVDQAQV